MSKKLLIITVLSNIIYVFWLSQNVQGWLGLILLVAEIALASMTILFLVNHWNQYTQTSTEKPALASVDVYITVVNEPIGILRPVVISALNIRHRRKQIYVLDDGGREDVRKLCAQYRVNYLSRANKPQDYKAGNLNFGLSKTTGQYILTLDADQRVTNPNIIRDLLGHFKDNPKLAFISTRQSFYAEPYDFNHDHLFYEHMQSGKQADNAAISTGSGIIYSRKALKAIGGFQTWSIIEDAYTSYTFHAAGFDSLYTPKSYTKGTAPQDLAGIYKQRGVWAMDSLRMLLKDNPWFKPGLSTKQRLHYTELGLAYAVSALAVPVLFILPIITLWLNTQTITNPTAYMFLRIPTLLLSLALYYQLSGNTLSTSQFWAGLFPVYAKALVLAVLPGKRKYTVTPKTSIDGQEIFLILPHLALIFASVIAVARYAGLYGFTSFLGANMVFMVLMVVWMWPILLKGFGFKQIALPVGAQQVVFS